MSADPVPSIISARGLRRAAFAAIVVAAAIVLTGVSTRRVADARLREWTERQALPVVAVAFPSTQRLSSTIDLPGRLEADTQARIFARVSGYIKDWKADIGTQVTSGQVLAEIDAPDLDQQILEAEAAVTSAEANVKLANATLERGQTLITTGAVSKQDLDQRAADFANKQGLLRSAQANLDRLRVLEQYKSVRAPFSGIVTGRATDIGALINAGSASGQALFVVSDISRLRAYVNVPEKYVPEVKMGAKARISVPEYRGRYFPATVKASARAVDPASGTTRMLLFVNNRDGALMPGAFADIELDLATPENPIDIPPSALIFDEKGLQVATVGPDDRVVLKRVAVARDLGAAIEIASGLAADDRVITTPPDGVASGDRVRIAGGRGLENSVAGTSKQPSLSRQDR